MKPCVYCEKETDGTLFVELRAATVSTNTAGNLTRRVKASRTVSCCDECKKDVVTVSAKERLIKPKKHAETTQGVQMTVDDVIDAIERGEA